MKLGRIGLAGALLGAAMMLSAPAFAQFGSRTIRIIFPFAAGGSGDAIARLIADKVSAATGQSVIVENPTGASGRIGVANVKSAEPDGNTLLMTPFTLMLIYPHIYPTLPYDPEKDFAPVSQVASFEFALTVAKSVPVKNVQEFVAWVKANPEKGTYGSPGAGTLPHLMGDAFSRAAGLGMQHLGYRGSSAAMADLLASQIPIAVLTTADVLESHKNGAVRILATFDNKRSPYVPDLPTIKESGFDLYGNGWFAFYAPAKTPAATLERLGKIISEAVKSKDVAEKIGNLGMVPTGTTPAELADLQAKEAAIWGPIVKASGFKPND